jgi:pyridoxine 5-phosphate synthase
LDLLAHTTVVRAAVERLHAAGIAVSLFIDPDPAQIEAAQELQADAIELQTASYSEARGEAAIAREWEKLRVATVHARRLGLHVHMGHGLNYTNVPRLVRIPGVEELNIGHSIVSRAVLVGIERAVREMKQLIQAHAVPPSAT